MTLGILKGFLDSHSLSYEEACKALKIDYKLIDLLSPHWIDLILNSQCAGFLCHPPCDFSEQKQIYDEKLYFINKVLGLPIYPSFEELFIYENKRNMAAWLQIHKFPHPRTLVFARKEDAKNYLLKASYPLVLKSNSGASASGVNIVSKPRTALKILNQVFGRFHPALAFGKIRIVKNRNKIPIPFIGDSQRHYLIVQDFMKLKWEWRIIKIGNSYFGHQKLLKGSFASGSGQVGWEDPPKELLYLVKSIAETGKFQSLSVDIFETLDEKYLVNEIQSMFGSILPYQMKVNNIPGRYVYVEKSDSFEFEEGEFNIMGSNYLRVEHFVNTLLGSKS